MDRPGSAKIKKINILVDLIIINSCFLFFSYMEFSKGIVHKDYFAFLFLFVSFNAVWFLLMMKQHIHER